VVGARAPGLTGFLPYHEAEVTVPDGRRVDVQLDEKSNVVGSRADRDGGAGDD
jgi:hypothetical protein